MRVRRAKYDRLRAAGGDPYPVGYPRTVSGRGLHARFPELPADTATGVTVSVAGRIVFKRDSGKLCFATLRDGADGGADLQVMVSLDRVGPATLAAWKADVDLGDQVGVTGEVITSRRGELSVLASSFALTAKALRPPPAQHKPLAEETRVRQRYVDLWVRPEARRLAEARVAVVRALRDTLHQGGFLEVETPMLQAVQGGATARPFTTHINAYDLDLYLRIAPELYLKRCIVGGLDKVFEINRNFRNEGADATHAPEFAMLEAYEAYGDYDSMARLTQHLVQAAATALCGSHRVGLADGSEYDFGGDWASISLFAAVSAALGEAVTPDLDLTVLRDWAARAGVEAEPSWGFGKLIEEIFEALVVPDLYAPTFVRDFPEDTTPLTRPHRSEPGVTEKWDLYVRGVELATAYSELVDPVLQRQRLVDQARSAARGDAEAMHLDEDFLRALEVGMPPTGGMGMGVDRLLVSLTGAAGVRETILFPLVRPEA
ncbi:MAG TPA: lysine--tRNA ligase [Mycobacteriales bacterium]|nr:lysine--tRNA ligase [Mycobacteriales bacterium]